MPSPENAKTSAPAIGVLPTVLVTVPEIMPEGGRAKFSPEDVCPWVTAKDEVVSGRWLVGKIVVTLYVPVPKFVSIVYCPLLFVVALP